MTQAQRNRLALELNINTRRINRLDAKMDKAEAEGNSQKYNRLDQLIDRALEYQEGVLTAIRIMGYTAKQDSGTDEWLILESM